MMTRETAYHPTDCDTGIAVIADYDMGTLEILHIWATDSGAGYWYDVTSNPGMTGQQICSGFYVGGSTLSGKTAPADTADRTYKTRAGLDRFIARARAAGCQTTEDRDREIREFDATPQGQRLLAEQAERYEREKEEEDARFDALLFGKGA